MSSFIDRSDYNYHIKSNRLDQILDDEDVNIIADELLDDAEEEAVQEVKDALHGKYDVVKIFNKTGSARPKNVLRWVKVLTISMIYERIPDELIPEQVLKNAEEVRKILAAIADGKRSVDLPLMEQVNDDGTTGPVTKFRWGSNSSRSH
jgi:hypothetical protein